jgi:hypothetical protein
MLSGGVHLLLFNVGRCSAVFFGQRRNVLKKSTFFSNLRLATVSFTVKVGVAKPTKDLTRGGDLRFATLVCLAIPACGLT